MSSYEINSLTIDHQDKSLSPFLLRGRMVVVAFTDCFHPERRPGVLTSSLGVRLAIYDREDEPPRRRARSRLFIQLFRGFVALSL